MAGECLCASMQVRGAGARWGHAYEVQAYMQVQKSRCKKSTHIQCCEQGGARRDAGQLGAIGAAACRQHSLPLQPAAIAGCPAAPLACCSCHY